MKNLLFTFIFLGCFIFGFSQNTSTFVPQTQDWGTYLPIGSAQPNIGGNFQFVDYNRFDIGNNDQIIVLWLAEEEGTNLDIQSNWVDANSHQDTVAGDHDIFLCSINPDGSLNWATYFGGEAFEWGRIRTDSEGNIYLSGTTFSLTGISTPGAYQTEHSNYYLPPVTVDVGGVIVEMIPEKLLLNPFLAKFSPDGELLWSTYFSGDKGSASYEVSAPFIGSTGIYLSMLTFSSEGIATPGSMQPAWPEDLPSEPDEHGLGMGSVGALVKFSFDGDFIWGTYLHEMSGTIVSRDLEDNIYIHNPNQNSTENPMAFTKINGADGSYLETIPYPENTFYRNIFFDEDGNTFIAGRTSSPDIGTPGTFNPTRNPYFNEEPFIEKYDSNMQKIWGTYLTRDEPFVEGENRLDNINVSSSGETFLSGSVKTNGLGTPGVFQEELEAMSNGYAMKLNSDGQLDWFTYYGGSTVLTNLQAYIYNSGKLGTESLVLFGVVVDDSKEENLTTPNGLIPYSNDVEPFVENRRAYLMRLIPEDTMAIDKVYISQVKLYPNPAQEQITVQSTNLLDTDTRLVIYDLLGRELTRFKGTNTFEQTIDISKLSGGVYFLSVEQNGQQEFLRFVKE